VSEKMSEGESERARERAKEGGRERMDISYDIYVCRVSRKWVCVRADVISAENL